MPAELSTTNGVYAFADSRVGADGRVAAWHRLGTPVGREMTAQEALEAAHLSNWNVRKVPLLAQNPAEDGAPGASMPLLNIPDRFGVVFDNPVNGKVEALSAVVGNRYEHAQNEALAQFGEAMVDEIGQRNWQTAGSLRGYTQVFLTMKMPQTMELRVKDGSLDVTEYYLALLNSHDGSVAITGLITPVRIVCANTQQAAIHSAVSSFKIRHTRNWQNALEEARRVLGIAFRYEEAFEAEVKRLYAMEMSAEQAKVAAEGLVELSKVDPDGRAATQRHNTANAIVKLFVSSPTIAGKIGGTRWGFYNAVSEYADHFQGVRNAHGDEASARAIRTITAAQANNGLKASAWKMMTESSRLVMAN